MISNVQEKNHVLVVGGQQIVGQMPNGVQFLVEDMYEEGKSERRLLGTDEGKEWMLYLRNLPNLRFIEAKKISVPCRLFLHRNASDSLKTSL